MSKEVNSAMWALKHPGKVKEMEERFGIDIRSSPGWKADSGESYQEYKDSSNWHNDIKDAARNDYDLRRTLEAAALSGKGKAKKILDKGFNNIEDVAKAMNFSEKAAKRHGQGGDFSSNSDYMGLTDSMVKRDRSKFTEQMMEMFNKDDKKSDKRDPLDDPRNPSMDDVELSPQAKAAMARFNIRSRDKVDGSESARIYGKESSKDDAYSQQAAFGFLGNYKDDLTSRFGLLG